MDLSTATVNRPAAARPAPAALAADEPRPADPLRRRARLYLRAAGITSEVELIARLNEAEAHYSQGGRLDRPTRAFEAVRDLAAKHSAGPRPVLPAEHQQTMRTQTLGQVPRVLRRGWWLGWRHRLVGQPVMPVARNPVA